MQGKRNQGVIHKYLLEAAEEDGLLVLLDDVQWLDDGSFEAVVFAIRRLHAEGVAVLLAAVMSMGGGVGVCASLVVAGTLSGHDATVLLPAIYLMGNPVQNTGRCLGTAGVNPKYYPHIITLCVINALLSMWVMQLLF